MRTTVYIGVSLDGFIAREDGNIDWLVKYENEEIRENFRKFIDKIDAIVIGRGTFEKVLTFSLWPYDRKVFLLSSTISRVPDPLAGKVSIHSMKPKELLGYLADEGFTNIYVDGGKVIQAFLQEDCIDELIITRIPVLTGSGIPLFGYLENDLRFEHKQTIAYSNGLVKSHYERKRK